MTSISTLIDFLMSLMRDEDAKREFEGNPDGTMADRGLQDVSAQDVRDARLIMADEGTAKPRENGGSQTNGHHDGGLTGGGSSSPVREILHTTNTFQIEQTNVNVDASRTTIIDSFNSQDTVTAIQDNDTINNDVDVVNVEDSFNDEDGDEEGEEEDKDADDTDEPTEPGEVTTQPVEAEEPVDFSDPDAEPGGEVSIQPVEDNPADEPFDGPAEDVSVEPEPEVSIQPVEDEPMAFADESDLPVA